MSNAQFDVACKICEKRTYCTKICDTLEKELPGTRSGGLPGVVTFLGEEALEYVAFKEGISWDDVVPLKRLFGDFEVDVLMDYRFSDVQRKFIYCRFFLDMTVDETRSEMGWNDNVGVDFVLKQIKSKMIHAHLRWGAWEAIKDIDFQIEYMEQVSKQPDLCGGLKLRSVALMYYKQLRTKKEISKELNISIPVLNKRLGYLKKIVKKMQSGVTADTA